MFFPVFQKLTPRRLVIESFPVLLLFCQRHKEGFASKKVMCSHNWSEDSQTDKKYLAFSSTIFMSHPAVWEITNHDTILRTNSYWIHSELQLLWMRTNYQNQTLCNNSNPLKFFWVSFFCFPKVYSNWTEPNRVKKGPLEGHNQALKGYYQSVFVMR